MSDEELYNLYVEHIWTQVPEVYRDELDQCETVILAGIREILDIARRREQQCICGGVPHVSHCPANPAFLKRFL